MRLDQISGDLLLPCARRSYKSDEHGCDVGLFFLDQQEGINIQKGVGADGRVACRAEKERVGHDRPKIGRRHRKLPERRRPPTSSSTASRCCQPAQNTIIHIRITPSTHLRTHTHTHIRSIYTMTSVPTFKLNTGATLPSVGMGCWMGEPGKGDEVISGLTEAFKVGYRHFDTAAAYANEKEVGIAINSSGVPREELFVTTKVWNDR